MQIFKNPIVIGIVAGLITYLLLYLYNYYFNKNNKKKKTYYSVIFSIVIAIIVTIIAHLYFKQGINENFDINSINEPEDMARSFNLVDNNLNIAGSLPDVLIETI